jgi:hypothetical protein
MIIGISGNRYSGKYTLSRILHDLDFCFYNFGILDDSKIELDDLLRAKLNISSFTRNLTEREKIDDFIFAYKELVENFNPLYWKSQIDSKILDKGGHNIIIRDIYLDKEYEWIRSKGGILIHINRFSNGIKVQGDNQLEAKADFVLNWQTSNDKQYLIDTVKLQLKDLLKDIK